MKCMFSISRNKDGKSRMLDVKRIVNGLFLTLNLSFSVLSLIRV